jgi:hypothetical protein
MIVTAMVRSNTWRSPALLGSRFAAYRDANGNGALDLPAPIPPGGVASLITDAGDR